MKLNELISNPGATKKRMRVGRGIGSGKGKTCGSGQKGQKARTGVAINGFEGGQNPLYRSVPKRGFTNIFRIPVEIVRLERLQAVLESGGLSEAVIDKAALANAGLIRKATSVVKLLGNVQLKQPVTIVVDRASAAAAAAVASVQGQLVLQENL